MRTIITAMLALACASMASCGGRSSDQAAGRTPPAEDARLAPAVAALKALPADAAAEAEAALRAAPDEFFSLLAAAEAESDAAGGLLLLVDKSRPLAPSFEPADLVPLNGRGVAVTREDLRLREAVMAPLLGMVDAARADGVTLSLGSAYRSYAYQEALFARYAAQDGEAAAARYSARAGASQHQLGTAFDFAPIDESFAGTAAGVWAAANAWRFGFSLSFPRDMEAVTGYIWESWHYRYITKPGALLERGYFGGVQQYLLEFLAAYKP